MTTKKEKLHEKPFFVDDELEEYKAEIARLRGALRAIKRLAKNLPSLTEDQVIHIKGIRRIAKLNLSWTPGYMLK